MYQAMRLSSRRLCKKLGYLYPYPKNSRDELTVSVFQSHPLMPFIYSLVNSLKYASAFLKNAYT